MGINSITKRGSDIASAVKRTFGDESGVQVVESDIMRWVNEAQLEIAMKQRILKAVSTGNIVAGTWAYPFPIERAIHIESIQVAGVRIKPATMTEVEETILSEDPTRVQTNRIPVLWYEYAGIINFWPTPAEDLTGGVSIFYVAAPAEITSLSDMLGLPDRYYQAMLDLVLARAYEMDENFDAVVLKQQQADNSLTSFVNEEQTSQHRTFGTIQVVD